MGQDFLKDIKLFTWWGELKRRGVWVFNFFSLVEPLNASCVLKCNSFSNWRLPVGDRDFLDRSVNVLN
jgi:hypothetical protein